MSSFTEPLCAIHHPSIEKWETDRAFQFYTDCDKLQPDTVPLAIRCRSVYDVPKGTFTDFASIPRLFWTLIGHPAGKYAQAGVLHDRLYQTQAVSRERADEIFLEAMEVLGVPRWQRTLMWAAVRVGGGSAYSQAGKTTINDGPAAGPADAKGGDGETEGAPGGSSATGRSGGYIGSGNDYAP